MRCVLKRILVAAGAAFAAAQAAAQEVTVTRVYSTCDPTLGTCGSVPIPDFPGGPVTLPLTIPSDPSGNVILHMVVGVWIQHSYQGDLKVELVSPLGTAVRLMDRPGLSGCPSFGFSADDFGGFYNRPAPCSGQAFEGMYFRDETTACPLIPATITYYDSPYVACPGFNQGGIGSDQCLSLVCGRQWRSLDPLAVFTGQSKAGTWNLRVTDMAGGDVGTIRYLSLSITSITQPSAVITAPAAFGLACDPTTIVGTATDASGSIQDYKLEFASNPLGPWALITMGASPVLNGTLGTWNTLASGAPEGYNFLRLTVTNLDGIVSQFTTTAYVDLSFTGIGIRSPLNNAIVGGNVCPDGTITDPSFTNYTIQYAPPPFSVFNAVDPSNLVYTTPIVNDPLGTWNTVSGGAAVADGDYRLRFQGTDGCGHIGIVYRDVVVDNTPPVAVINAPTPCGFLCGSVPVTGTVSDAHLSGWTLQYTGGPSHGWTTIASGSTNVFGGVLANWNTSTLPRCAYVLRLIASDQASVNCGTTSNSTEYLTAVNIGAYANCDSSSTAPILNVADFACFLNSYAAGGGCPQ
jgi:subtilisin-like proprotein convertase family protein